MYNFEPGILCRSVIIAVQCLTEAAGRAPVKYRGDRQRCRSVWKTTTVGGCNHMLQKAWENGKGRFIHLLACHVKPLSGFNNILNYAKPCKKVI